MVDAMTIKEVTISAKKTTNNGTLDIPTREISMAMQTISTKEFEGLSVVSVDDALQGRISGLDIVSNSGDAGSGSSMRIRGITSINSSSEPLIVLNGVIFETPAAANFEFATANQEQFADLLSVNVDDIETITVLKDAASTAVWGSRGANGVYGMQNRWRQLDLMQRDEFAETIIALNNLASEKKFYKDNGFNKWLAAYRLDVHLIILH